MSLSPSATTASTATTLRMPRRAEPKAAPNAPLPIAAAPLPSDQLLQGRKAIEISHNGSVYRLQATKLGKLILTK